ncbi:OmpH family outer membrane protein, partial [bacterium]|nr:OmpH family outer membrane protein [Candidatus Elulimicrobium humile]
KKLAVVFAIFVSLTSIAQQKIGHVNTQRLLDTLPSRKVAMSQIEDFEKRGMEELKEMEADLQKRYSKYMAEQATLSPIIKQNEEEQLIAFNWRNTMPLSCEENLKKGNKIIKSQVEQHYKKLVEYHTENKLDLPQVYIDLFANGTRVW